MKIAPILLSLTLLLSHTSCQQEDEASWLTKEKLVTQLRAGKEPALLAIGLAEAGKYQLPKADEPLDTRFSSNVFVVVSHLEEWLAQISSPEDDFPQAWNLMKNPSVVSGDQVKAAQLALEKAQNDQAIAVKALQGKVADDLELKANELEIRRQDELVKTAQADLDNLKKRLQDASKYLEHGVEDLAMNFRLRLGGQTFGKLSPDDRVMRLSDSLYLLKFPMRNTNQDKDAWLRLLKSSPLDSVFCDVSLAYQHEENRESILGGSPSPRLRIPLFRWPFWISFAIIALFVFLFVRNVRTTEILRDPGITLVNRDPESTSYWQQHLHPLSLGRLQMSIWFFIIIGSFVFLWSTTGSLAGVSTTAFALMGISGGTTVVSAFISNKQEWDVSNRRVSTANASHAALWVTDLLSDENGPTIHRFQMLAWTLVLGVVFINGVITDYAMPVFNSELLGLMGISSGIYVGFKMKEGGPVQNGGDGGAA